MSSNIRVWGNASHAAILCPQVLIPHSHDTYLVSLVVNIGEPAICLKCSRMVFYMLVSNSLAASACNARIPSWQLTSGHRNGRHASLHQHARVSPTATAASVTACGLRSAR